MTIETSTEIEAARAELRSEFPGWTIIHTSDTGRWWATRTSRRAWLTGPLLGEHMAEHMATEVDADTPAALRAKLREVR